MTPDPELMWVNQSRTNYNSTTPPIVLDKIYVQGNASYQLIAQHDSTISIESDQKQNESTNSLKTVDKEFASPIDGVDFFNTERPGNMSMYNETIVSSSEFKKLKF